jgi:ATP-binding cassette subfamily B protein
MRVVQSFNREQAAFDNFRAVADRYRLSNMQTVVLNGIYFPVVDLLSSVALAVVLAYGGHLYFGGTLTLGTLFAFMLYVQNFFDPVQQLSQLYNTFLSATAALDKIIGVLDEQPEVLDRPGARELAQIDGHVSFEGIRFTYGRGDEVLHGIDLDVPAGTTVALVGHTGAGKSTIAKLLARFYEPTHGRLTIDGVDVNDVTQASLRRQLGVVPQEGFLFAGTVAENIAFGRPDATADEIVRAAHASRSASASSSRSRARCLPIRGSSSSTRRRRRSTSAPSDGSRRRSACCSPTAPRSSSRIASRRSAMPT